jgi:hypothetical protein
MNDPDRERLNQSIFEIIERLEPASNRFGHRFRTPTKKKHISKADRNQKQSKALTSSLALSVRRSFRYPFRLPARRPKSKKTVLAGSKRGTSIIPPAAK